MKALLTIDHSEGAPKYLVTPEIAETPTPKVLIDGVGTASLIPYHVLLTINPGTDVDAASRLLAGYPDCVILNIGQQIEISSDEIITDLYLIAIGNTSAGPTTAAPANYTGNYGIVANTETDIADYLAQDIRFTFDEADVVKKVRLTCTDIIGTNYVTVAVEGLSYA
jgi:hypothetical protein